MNTLYHSIGESDKNETFFNLILGTDYHINDYNVLTLSGHFAYEWETEHSDAVFSTFDAGNTLTDAFHRSELTTATNPKYSYELQYKKDFEGNEDQSLLISATGNLFAKDQSSDFTNTVTLGDDDDMHSRPEPISVRPIIPLRPIIPIRGLRNTLSKRAHNTRSMMWRTILPSAILTGAVLWKIPT